MYNKLLLKKFSVFSILILNLFFVSKVNATMTFSATTIGLGGSSSGTVTLQPATIAGTWVLTLPTTPGSVGQFLRTDGAGVTSWQSVTASSAGSDTQVQYNNGGSLGANAGFVYDGVSKLTLGAVGVSKGQIVLSGNTSGTLILQPTSIAGSVIITFPPTTGIVVTTGDVGTVTNTMLAGGIATSKIANDATGNLSVSHLDNGTSASSSTFWRGDGTWAAPSGGGAGAFSAITAGTNTTAVMIVGSGASIIPTGTGQIIPQINAATNGASMTIGTVTEELTLAATPVSSVADFFPANSMNKSLSCIWTQSYAGTGFSGIIPSNSRTGISYGNFEADPNVVGWTQHTLGNSTVFFAYFIQITGDSSNDRVSNTAGKLVLTPFVSSLTAGKIRCTAIYELITPPTS